MFAALLFVLAAAPECVVANGQQVCGYHCLTHPKGAVCSATAEGQCTVVDGEPLCWDPSLEVRLHAPKATPTCHAKFGKRVCGFACATTQTELGCAQTPWGQCTSKYNHVFCWDPSAEVIHQQAPGLSRAACVSNEDHFACGWSCVSNRDVTACAQTPAGQCSLFNGKAQCFDPPVPPVSHSTK